MIIERKSKTPAKIEAKSGTFVFTDWDEGDPGQVRVTGGSFSNPDPSLTIVGDTATLPSGQVSGGVTTTIGLGQCSLTLAREGSDIWAEVPDIQALP